MEVSLWEAVWRELRRAIKAVRSDRGDQRLPLKGRISVHLAEIIASAFMQMKESDAVANVERANSTAQGLDNAVLHFEGVPFYKDDSLPAHQFVLEDL